ncbi:hypothetical protein N806_01325 [Rhodococcus sp. P27]|nr:hypothetical protein N806_01325 [Rhodococcus sp. P27]
MAVVIPVGPAPMMQTLGKGEGSFAIAFCSVSGVREEESKPEK